MNKLEANLKLSLMSLSIMFTQTHKIFDHIGQCLLSLF